MDWLKGENQTLALGGSSGGILPGKAAMFPRRTRLLLKFLAEIMTKNIDFEGRFIVMSQNYRVYGHDYYTKVVFITDVMIHNSRFVTLGSYACRKLHICSFY